MIGLALLPVLLGLAEDDTPVSLADLPAYKAALEADPASPAVPVGFRDLWDRPDHYRGQRVRVEGTVRRRFRGPASGKLPARVEVWVQTASGDVLCLVSPEARGAAQPAVGTPIRFAGTFLRRVSYEGGDGTRLAPLIVGPTAPEPTGSSGPKPNRGSTRPLDWTLAAVVALGVLLILGRQYLGRPSPQRMDRGTRPEFLDDRPGGDGDERRDGEG